MKKLSLGLATLATSLALAPAVFADVQLGTVSNVTLDSCTEGTTTPATITPEDGKATKVDVAFTDLCLVYQEADNSGEQEINKRPKDKAWIGFQMTAPTDISNNIAQVTLPSGDKIDYQVALDNKESDQKVASFWKGITKEDLEKLTSEGKSNYTYTFVFDWDGEAGNEDDQTVNLIINTTQITLQDTEKKEIFTPANAEANIAEYVASQQQPTDTPTETPAETPTEEAANPNTADPIALYATIAVLAVLGLGATAFLAKKSNR